MLLEDLDCDGLGQAPTAVVWLTMQACKGGIRAYQQLLVDDDEHGRSWIVAGMHYLSYNF